METLPPLRAYIPGLYKCHVHFIVSHCINHSSFPLQCRMELYGSSKRAVSSSLTQHSLWPNGGEGVFMAQSGPFRLSGATQNSLWGPCRYTRAHEPVITHDSHQAETPGFLHPCATALCVVPPSRGPLQASLFIETSNCCELFPISRNWLVEFKLYSEISDSLNHLSMIWDAY